MKERDVERYLVKRVKELGGEVRKVAWVGRQGAPDRVVLLPRNTIWVELKNPVTVQSFPATARERAQAREHERMRNMGQHVVVVGTLEGVDTLLRGAR